MYENLWYFLFVVLLVAYLFIQFKVENKKKYFSYFLAGSVVGFYFDIVSVSQGYYSYTQYFPSVFGVPLSVTLAEGFSVVITIYMFLFLYKKINSFFRQ